MLINIEGGAVVIVVSRRKIKEPLWWRQQPLMSQGGHGGMLTGEKPPMSRGTHVPCFV